MVSRKPPQGSLEAKICELGDRILSSTDDWEVRNAAVLDLQQLVQSSDASLFNKDVWRALKEPLQYTLQDLRSSLVREACKLLTLLAELTGDGMRPLMRELIVLLLQLAGSANGVIQEYVDAAIVEVIRHTRFPRQIKDMVYEIKNSRSKDLRDIVAKYLLLILELWPQQVLDKEAVLLQEGLQVLLEDASPKAREIARLAFPLFRSHWPNHAEKILERVDGRTARLLRAAVSQSPSTKNQVLSASELTSCLSRPLGRSHSARDMRTNHSRTFSGSGTAAEEVNGEGDVSPSSEDMCLNVGDHIALRQGGQPGYVRYIGPTQFATGLWVGVELDEAVGKNNGSVNGVAYFSCQPDFGVFVRAAAVEKSELTKPTAHDTTPTPHYTLGEVSPSAADKERVTESSLLLLAAHKVYLQTLLETLKDDAELIPTLESLVQTGKPLSDEQVRKYIKTLEQAVELRHSLGIRLLSDMTNCCT